MAGRHSKAAQPIREEYGGPDIPLVTTRLGPTKQGGEVSFYLGHMDGDGHQSARSSQLLGRRGTGACSPPPQAIPQVGRAHRFAGYSPVDDLPASFVTLVSLDRQDLKRSPLPEWIVARASIASTRSLGGSYE